MTMGHVTTVLASLEAFAYLFELLFAQLKLASSLLPPISGNGSA